MGAFRNGSAHFSFIWVGTIQVREIGVYYPLQSKLAVYPFTWVKPPFCFWLKELTLLRILEYRVYNLF